MQKLVNLTREAAVLFASDRKTILFVVEVDGTVAEHRRVRKPDGNKALQHITGGPSIPVVVEEYSQVLGLPEPVPGITWIVDEDVRRAVPHRKDVVSLAFPVTSRMRHVVMGHTALERNP